MSSTTLRPILRTPTYLASPNSSFICQQCRHMRLLRRPKRPYTFTQLVTLSDGSAFTLRTTSPTPVYRSTRDTRNAPLWNPRSKELLNVEADDAGRLAGFRARFGGVYDVQRDAGLENIIDTKGKKQAKTTMTETTTEGGEGMETGEMAERRRQRDLKVDDAKREKQKLQQKQSREEDVDEGWDFGEDDENVLDLISRFGQEETGIQKDAPIVRKKK